MRIVFMGTPDFAVPSLKALVEGGYSVVGVVTQPDRPKGRGKKLAMSPVKEYAIQQGIPVLQPERISRDGYEDLLNLHPDLCITAAFGQIFRRWGRLTSMRRSCPSTAALRRLRGQWCRATRPPG